MGGDTPEANTFTTLADTAVTQTTCAAEATRRSAELWSFTAAVDGGDSTCRLSTWEHMSDATWDANAVTQVAADTCAAMACPTAPPTGAWPGADAAASNAAFGGHQPTNLMCWPKNSLLELMDCGHTVVQTRTAGWPGTCNNLDAAPTTGDGAVSTQDACRTSCVNDPFCSVWMCATPESGINAGPREETATQSERSPWPSECSTVRSPSSKTVSPTVCSIICSNSSEKMFKWEACLCLAKTRSQTAESFATLTSSALTGRPSTRSRVA